MSVFSRLWNSLTGRAAPIEGQTAGTSPRPEPAPRSGAQRRRFPRLRVLSALEGYAVDADAGVTVLEISLGGFSLKSTVMFDVGSEQTFLFSTTEGGETMVRCVCRHTRRANVSGDTGCVAGFEFLPGQEASLQVLVEVYERLRRRGV